VDADPVEARVEVVGGLAADGAVRHAEPVDILPGHEPFAERRPDRVPDREIAEELVEYELVEVPLVVHRHQHRQEGRACHPHMNDLTGSHKPRHPPSSGEWIEVGR